MYAVGEMERMVAAVSFSVPSSLKQWSIPNAPMPLPPPQLSSVSKIKKAPAANFAEVPDL